jgi:hypothetical protein
METESSSSVAAADPAAWLARRLEELRRELAAGEAQLLDLDRRRAGMRETLLRISGAIQVLEELAIVTDAGDSAAASANGRSDD